MSWLDRLSCDRVAYRPLREFQADSVLLVNSALLALFGITQ
ncbi:hypothetical protein ACN4EK_24750 [Pantanalinema rosaneae CENA516]